MIRYDKNTNLLHVGERRYPVQHWRSGDGYGARVRQAILTFENRWGLSIIWGSMNYSDNYEHHGPLGDIWKVETQPFVEEPEKVEVGVFSPTPRVLSGMSPETVECMRQMGSPMSDESAASMTADRETDLACDPFGWCDADEVNTLADLVMTLPSHPDDVDAIGEQLEKADWRGTT